MPVEDFSFEDMNQLNALHKLVNQNHMPQINGDKTAILMIGNSGAGKSSTIKMLVDKHATHQPVIGERRGRSQTVFPESFADKNNPNLLYIDYPGFEDTRPDNKPAFSLILQSLVHHNQIKGILIMVDTRSLCDKANSLLKLLETLNQLLKQGIQIETSCIFGITRVAPKPDEGTEPDPEAIYSLESLHAVLEDLREGCKEDLEAEIEKLKTHARQQNKAEFVLNEFAHQLIARSSIIVMIQNAIQAERVVLVPKAPNQETQTCEKLRQCFQVLVHGNSINDALNFESYDKDRTQFMNKILKQATSTLEILEHENTLIKQYHYLSQSYSKESSEQRIANIQSDITPKEEELARINKRDTASEPYWMESKKLVPERYSEGPQDICGYMGSVNFTYPKNAPISRIELIGGHHFSYLKTFWNSDERIEYNVLNTIVGTPLRLAAGLITLGLWEILFMGVAMGFDSYKFDDMHLSGEYTTINSVNWEKNIDLPVEIESKHAQFIVYFSGSNADGIDCYNRIPTVKIYVPICYMEGNPERIASLNSFLSHSKQQIQDIKNMIQRADQILEDPNMQWVIQEELLNDKKQSLERTIVGLKSDSDKIEQQGALIKLIYGVFMILDMPVHENIQKFMQLWTARDTLLQSIMAVKENAPSKLLSTDFKNNTHTLFSQNQNSAVRKTEHELKIQAPSSNLPKTGF